MEKDKTYRILDANLNRICEGIRVVEDIARFAFENKDMQKQLRDLRHAVRELFKGEDELLIKSRDAKEDIGKIVSSQSTADIKNNLENIVLANFRRAEESFRVIEELLKNASSYDRGKQIEDYRFTLYTIEKKFWALDFFKNNRRKLPKGLYGITAENFSNGLSNYDCVKKMLDSGIRIIQYREKYKDKREKFEEAKALRKLTSEYDAIFIVNDDIDIAIAVGADGVHVGQDDLHPNQVRALVGEDMLIGLSTHSPEQAKEASQLDIDYIGVGPIFSTKTKVDVCDPVGLEYLEYVVKNVDIEYVAIGGIKEHNLQSVLDKGARRVCLVTEIVGAEKISEKIDSLEKMIKKDGRK